MPDWFGILLGAALIGLVWTERHDLPDGRRKPARPAQAFNLVLGLVLGVAAIVYGVISLLG